MSRDKIPLNYSGSLKKFSSFRNFYSKKKIPESALHFDTTKSIKANLKHLSSIALDPSLTTAFLHSLDQIFLDFASRWISDSSVEHDYLQMKSLNCNIRGSTILSALGRVVSLAPEIAPLIEYFLENNNVFYTLQASQDLLHEEEVREILLAFYRLLYFDHERFSRFVTPETLSDLLHSSSNPVITYLIIQILSKYLDFSEKVKNEMLNNYVGESSLSGIFETDQGVDYTFLPVIEARRLANYYQLKASVEEDSKDDSFIEIDTSDLSTLVVSVCGVLVPKIHFDQQTSRSEGFVPTDRSVDILRKLAFHAQHSSPVMLVGGAGSGKTFIINELSKYLACDKTMVKIHLGEHTDAKLLLGTYTSGQKPGTFEWRHGVLTTAVKEGRWVLIEDIDKAPTEVLSILLSLLEKRELTIPSRGETITAANGFQLISTIRKTNDSKKSNIPDLIGLRLWNILTLEDPSKEELTQILSTRYPLLHKMIPTFIKLYEGIQDTYSNKSFLLLNKGSHPRIVSVRDLIKFCNRVHVLFLSNSIKDPNQLLQSSVVDDIFAEAVDCFASAVNEASALAPLISSIGEALEIPSSRVQLFLNKHVPVYEEFEDRLIVGRSHLKKAPRSLYRKKNTGNNTSFARTNHSLRLMEQIGVSIQMTEPVLLVGETGTGKTTVVQQIAKQLNKQITVINVSQQTETGDLLGGYKPVNTKTVAVPIQEEFLNLFHLTFSAKKNEKFESMLIKCFNRSQWKNVVKLWNEAVKLARQVLNKQDEEIGEEVPKKRRRLNSNDKILLLQKWDEFRDSVKNFEIQSDAMKNSFVFHFVEGSLVQAVKNGDWLLLDEINLASSDTLESISDLLSDVSSQRSLLLSEKGEVESVQAHPDFRIFGCMNPATDVGKRDLPLSIRSRFTEIYVHSPDGDISDLLQIIDKYVGRYALNDEWVGNDIAQLYLEAKKLAENNQIVDGANQKPHFSIRTLTRTLLYVCDIVSIYGLRRSLFEGFSMSFLTLLDQKSEAILKPLIEKYTIERLKNAKSVISQIPPAPSAEEGEFVQFRHYWMKQGSHEVTSPNYIITPFVEKNLLNLVRATSGKRFPILVQGPTSSGKTSMIKYLAEITGNKFVRINNHEHTDLQEYLGSYISDDTGKLSFKEGVLVEALRKGHWLVLDELNLAPTDVLEALNRLLDDNRELFIPETQEVVHPHPDFMLFATQNPPGLYGGRKVLSRAFRNRFLELHFDDIPQDELEIILRERCQIAPSYAKKIVEVYRQLSIQRQSSRLFEQKNSFATLRDLFRWALREAVGYEQLAANGYMLLAERVRKQEEKLVVKETLEKVMKVKLDMDAYYYSLENKELLKLESSIVWTKAIRRLAVLISTSLANNEPILLVGETGCGKTTICQLLAEFNGKKLITVNAHQNTETGDLLGAQRPVRNKSDVQKSLIEKLTEILEGLEISEIPEDLSGLLAAYDRIDKSSISEGLQGEVKHLRDGLNILFEWTDGPLIQALRTGQYFLLDEISLADDSVLERLNSVLEPERSLLLAEKGTDDSSITAADGFQFMATMNPGGDYGKKELSPALRNRFTEIWVPSMEDFNDVQTIVEAKLSEDLTSLAPVIVAFAEKFGKRVGGGNISSGVISLRDILAWVQFVNRSYAHTGSINASLLHGAAMVFIDALGTNNTAHLAESEEDLLVQKLQCVKELSKLVNEDLVPYYTDHVSIELSEDFVKAGMFQLGINKDHAGEEQFSFDAPTTASNAMRVIRALQLTKPILLEGSPGVGKTSLVSALAKATGNALTRINLSEQTDLVDLFGSDAPVEGGKTGEFAWRDAPFLRAMQKGEWVLLDEMNLASQAVLEGLNACLDHRGEAYIPELDRSFPRHPNFLVFAAQNPQYQGGGRKGLPKSFVNRFSVVYVDTLTSDDLVLIANHLYPKVASETCSKMIKVVSRLEHEILVKKQWGTTGGPWEFNLRDTLRWLQIYSTETLFGELSPVDFLNIIVCQRFRSSADQERARALVQEIFDEKVAGDNFFTIGESFVQAKKALSPRSQTLQLTSHRLSHLQSNTPIVESSLLAIKNNWPLIYVGSSNSGKTELVRYLATLTGNKMVEFSMNSDIDSMDILGGYEQVDLTRQTTAVIEKLSVSLKALLATQFRSSSEVVEGITKSLSLLNYIKSTHITVENFSSFVERFNSFKDIIVEKTVIENINEDIGELSEKINEHASVKFEWFDGLLVKAVEQGHWIVLDNANLCSPSVLDRLNSLLEIDGSLIINECSLVDGQPRVLRPHKNFRLFMTMDPKFGELSRAMRNRGVEIYVETLETRSSFYDKHLLGLTTEILSDVVSELDIKELSVTDQSFVPTAKFIEPHDSTAYQIASLSDSIGFSNPSKNLSKELATIVPFVSLATLSSFVEAATRSSEFTDEFRSLLQELQEYSEYLSTTGFTSALHRLYESIALDVDGCLEGSVYYDRFQSLNPLWNIYVYHSFGQHSKENAEDLVYFFEVISSVYEGLRRLEAVELRGANAKLNELSYIEQGAAVSSGRTLKYHPKINIYELSKGIYEFILNKVRSLTAQEIVASVSMFESLNKLCLLWISLFDSSSIKNDAKTRVYQQMIQKWAQDAEKLTDTKDLQSIFENFEADLKLNRGQLMTPIWESFRGCYPQSAGSWAAYEKLFSLMNEFDTVVNKQFSDSNELVSILSSAMLGIEDTIVNSGSETTEEAFSKLQDGIKQLREISTKFLIQRSHNFQESFSLLFNYAISDKRSVDGELLSLAQYAGVGVSAFSGFENRIYPKIFDLLWSKPNEQGSCKSKVQSLFTDTFLQTVFTNVNKYNDFAGNQLDQTVSDSLEFSKHLIKHSSSVLKDRIGEHKKIIVSWYIKVLQLVTSENVSHLEWQELSPNVILSLKSISSQVEDPFFLRINDSFLLPSLVQLLDARFMGDLGRAWVLFSIGLIQLYVPDSPFDPAIEDHIVYENFERKKQLCKSIAHSFKAIKSVYFGDYEMFIERALPTVNDDDVPEKPRVFRTSLSIDNLFEEWQSFMSSTLDLSALQTFLKEAKDAELEEYSLQMELFQQNSSNFIERLRSQFTNFADVNEIFNGYIYGLKLGFDLILESKKADETEVKVSPLWFISPHALTNNRKFTDGFDQLKELCKSIDVNSASGERILKFLMDYLLSGSKVNEFGDDKLAQVFQSLYYRWSLRRTRKEQKEAEEGNLFKYKGEVNEDEDFKSLFPDYEEFLHTSNDFTIEKSATELDDEQSAIAERYIAIFANRESADLKSLITEGSEIARSLIQVSSQLKPEEGSDPSTFAAVIQALNKSIDAARITAGSELDFYHGYSPAELKRSVGLIQNLLNSVNSLLEQWPEHDTLRTLRRTSYEYLEFPVKTPLARLIQKIEQIYTYISEWEKYASVKVSLISHFDELTRLIVSWRKLELSCWKSLFRNEDRMNEKSNGTWWYNLFETIIMPAYNDEYVDVIELITSVNIFMSKSTYGQFQPRLDLLKAFTEHALMISKSSRLKNSLKNLITFYEQFAPIIGDALTSERKKLQKDVDEVVLLASWKDVNIDALKQSARRSHNSLYKIIRKYRDVLAREVTSLIEQGISAENKVQFLSPGVSVSRSDNGEVPEIGKEVQNSEIWEKVPAQMKKNSIVVSNMEVFTGRIKAREYPNLNGFTGDVLTEIDRLKKETPKELKEDNKKLVAALKTQKRKLLSDSIRELKRIGLKSHLRHDIHKLQSSSTLILSKAESFRQSKIADIDSYFFRIVDLIPRLRAAVSSVAIDVPPSDAEKGLAIVENLVYVLLNNKKPILNLSNNFEKLEEIQKVISRSVSVTEFIARDDVINTVEDAEHVIKWLPQILDFAIETLEICSRFTNAPSDASIFLEVKSKIRDIASELESRWYFSADFSRALTSFEATLIEVLAKLDQWRTSNTEVAFLATMVINWIQDNKVRSLKSNVEVSHGLRDLDGLLKGICSRILVVFQKVTQAQSAAEFSYDHDLWFSDSQKELSSIVKSLHIGAVVKSFESLIKYVESKTLSAADSLIVKSLLVLVDPFLKRYMELSATVLNKASQNYVSVGRSTYLLATILYNLAKDGFCSPEPPTETKQDNNLQEGTGLGDGEGANNASNDVEDDEDLTEDAQEPNKEKDENNDGDDNNDDAVDVQGDMAGDLEDLSDQEKSDNEDEDGGEDEEELDEEVDDLDDLDPNAVDDKMWDEEAKEDNKQKDSENMPENSKADDIEAKEDEEPSRSSDEKKPNDHGDEDDNDKENDDDAEEEEDVGQQDDEVKNEDREELDQNVPETETLDLPDDINLDSGEEDEEEKNDDDGAEEEKIDDGLDDNMDLDDQFKDNEIEEAEDAEVEKNEEGEDEKDGEEEIAEKNDSDYDHDDDEGNQGEEEDPLQADENSEDEDLKGTDQLEEDKADDTNDGDRMEGIDIAETGDNNNDDIDMETAVEQQSGNRGDGAQTEADNEQEDVGASGAADHQDQSEKELETQDNARNDIKESMKQLGDSLKEFHRRHQEINEASEKDETVEQKANERPDEFEHVNGDNTETDTQALGAANKDQVSKIDDDMAIDDDLEEEAHEKQEEPEVKEEVNDSDIEEIEKHTDDKPDEFNGKNKGGFIGERKNELSDDEDFIKAELDKETDSDEEMSVSALPEAVIDDDSDFRDIEVARELWRKSELETQDLAANLCEQLRLILEPTLSTKLKGDYKTGKRLNMKRIIPYIASDFRKDKIWLRRTKPSKRQYQIMIAVDDSKSMSESKSVDLAFQSICLVSKALTQLESGGLSIVKFGENVKVVHPFDKQFSSETGAKIFQKFDFQQTRTNTRKLVSESIEIFNNARALGDSDLWQLQIIISDGVCEDHDTLQRLVRRAREEKIMLVFVVIDGINSNESIMDMSQVSYVPDASGNMVLKVDKYLDTFPFEFYVVVHDITELPKMLSLILRQYFQELASVS